MINSFTIYTKIVLNHIYWDITVPTTELLWLLHVLSTAFMRSYYLTSICEICDLNYGNQHFCITNIYCEQIYQPMIGFNSG